MADRKVTVQLVVKPPNLGEVQRSIQGQSASSIAGQFNTQKIFGGGTAAAPKATPAYAALGAATKTPAAPSGAGRIAGGVQAAGALAGGNVGGAAAGIGQLAGAAGPAAIAVSAGMAALGVAKTVGEIPGKLVASGISAVASSLKGLQTELGPINVGFSALETGGKAAQLGIASVAAAVGGPLLGALVYGLGAGLLKVIGPAKELTEAMFGLAKAANPAAGKQFDYAIQDSAAVMGRVFVPVLRSATDAVRLFGDILASVLPTSSEVQSALAPMKDVFGDIRDAAADVTPIVRNVLLTALQMLGNALKTAAEQITAVYKAARLFFGLSAQSGKGLASSQDASASQASFHGFEEFAKQNQARAYSQGTQNVTPSEGYLKEIRDFVKLMQDPAAVTAKAVGFLADKNWQASIVQALTESGAGLSAQFAAALKNAVPFHGRG